LLSYKTLGDNIAKALENFYDPEIEIVIVEGLREGILPGLDKEVKNGVEVVIGGGANAQIAHNFCPVPVIEYRSSQIDIMWKVKMGSLTDNHIAIVSYKNPLDKDLCQYINSIGMQFTNIIYETDEELREKLEQFPASGVILGTAHPYDLARQMGRKGLSIDPNPEKIRECIGDAKKIAEKVRRQKEQFDFAQAIIRHNPFGMLLIDKNGMVFDCNSNAEKQLNKASASIRGASIAELLPESRMLSKGYTELHTPIEIDGRMVYCDMVQLTGNSGNLTGEVIFLHGDRWDAGEVRMASDSSGFKAKMTFQDIFGESAAIREAIENARFFAKTDANVLLCGETGVGKELFAQSIHNASDRKHGPFIAVNCASLSESLLESELFGYDEGAFTGGRRGGKKGIFELASKGSILLDEIGEISQSMQIKLLRVLQEREIMRVGGDKIIPVDIRIICATNKDLEQVNGGVFRRDLYYRLSVLEFRLPPLREREDDAWLLFNQYFNQRLNLVKYGVRLPESIKKILTTYTWPGNIRELQNVCERFSLYINNNLEHNEKFLKRSLVKAIGETRLLGAILERYGPQGDTLSEELVELLQNVFEYSKGQVAEKIGISRTTLWRLTKK